MSGEAETPAGELVEPPRWPDLTALADRGDLLVEDGIAFACATLCADLIERLAGVVENAHLRIAVADYAYPPLVSLEELDREFVALGADFEEIIGSAEKKDTHIYVLDNMLETFIAAGKAYQEAEDISSSAFDWESVRSGSGNSIDQAISSVEHTLDNLARGWSSDGMTPHSGDIHSESFLRGRLEAMETAGASVPLLIDPEFHLGVSYEQLYDLGAYIRARGLAGDYENAGTRWYQMGDTIAAVSTDFNNRLIGSTADAWQGEGKSAAIGASQYFAGQRESLVQAMWRVGDAYRLAAYWLDTTQAAMPVSATSGFTTSTYNPGTNTYSFIGVDQIDAYRLAYNSTYVAGFEETARLFPNLPRYVTATGPPAQPTDDSQGTTDDDTDGTGAGLGGTKPDLPGGTGGSLSDEEIAARSDALAREWAAQTGASDRAQQDYDRQQLAQQGQQALQQVMGTAQQAVQSALGAAQQLSNAAVPGDMPAAGSPFVGDTHGTAGLPGIEAGGPGGDIRAGGNSPGSGKSPALRAVDQARLFPRAGLPSANATPAASASSPNVGTPMGSPPMGAPGVGAPAGRGNGQGDDKQRARHLDRADNMDDVLGDPPEMTRPVVGEVGVRRRDTDRPGSSDVVPPVVPRPRREVPRVVPPEVPGGVQRPGAS